MKRFDHLLLSFLLILFCFPMLAQDGGRFSGGFEGNGNWFQRDAEIGADNTPQYDHQLIGTDSWLDLGYSNWGYDFGVRFDLFNNSNLLNPTDSYTDQGIGKWFVKKTIDKFSITGGYIYDQIGSGIIFRAYEQRPLLIDNALIGIRLGYQINDNWAIKAFTGKQRRLFESFPATQRGAALDGFLSFGGGETGKQAWSLAPGIGIVNRTLADGQMDDIVSILSTYQEHDRVKPVYNVYMATVYNTLSYGPISWYVEGAYKSDDTFFDPMALRTSNAGGLTLGKLVSDKGYVGYTSISYSQKGFGVSVDYKRTENFDIRVDPLLLLNEGLISFLPPMNRLNSYRLTARYNPATQFIGEQAFQIEARYSPIKKLSLLANFSNITDLNDELLYREIYTEAIYKYKRKWILTGGVQLQTYNQEIYETKPEVPIVETVTPYLEFLYKFNRKKSIRIEAQYMSTDQDFGSWVFGLAEFGIAPHWLFEVSGMYNIDPVKKGEDGKVKDPILYPTLGVVYSHGSNRYGLRYVKQVEGVVCSGGICRLEPAFSGIKLQISSIF